MKRDAILWAGILTGPIVWFCNLETNFALAPLACAGSGKGILHIVSAVALVLTVISALASWTQWHAVKHNEGDAGDSAVERSANRKDAMALSGMALSGLAFLVILAQMVPNVMLAGCE